MSQRSDSHMPPLLEQVDLISSASLNGVLIVDGAGRIVFVNIRTEHLFGYQTSELLGQPVEILIPERQRDAHRGMRAVFAQAPKMRQMGVGADFLARRKDGSEFQCEIGLNPIHSTSDHVLAVITDITERKRGEEHQKLLIGELNHRIQNLFSVIQSVATNSLSGNPILVEARDAFVDRLQSLGRAYGMLTEQEWRGAPLRKILEAETSAFADQVSVDGPDVMVREKSAQSIAMVLHELTTNAVKYGALSADAGRVAVRWSIDSDQNAGKFALSWEEAGGPPVVPPTRTGYGSRVIDSTMRRLGTHQFEYAPGGLKYRMEAPLEKVGWVMNADTTP
jgi:PAS domain S-box-containing protein